VSAEAVLSVIEGHGMGLTAEQEQAMSDIGDEFADTWVAYSSELQAGGEEDGFDIGTLFTDLQESWEGGGDSGESPIDRDEVSDEGTHEERNDHDVSVYTVNE